VGSVGWRHCNATPEAAANIHYLSSVRNSICSIPVIIPSTFLFI
jgi:hypothetical protein